jgi:hypothetical protein
MKAILSTLLLLILVGCSHLNDCTTGKSDLCEVHHVHMIKRPLRFAHGMIPMSKAEAGQGEWKRRMDHYPHPGDCIPATDIVLPGQEGRAIEFVCTACTRAQRQMAKAQP